MSIPKFSPLLFSDSNEINSCPAVNGLMNDNNNFTIRK
jgi:hypothetical protein